MEGVLQAAVEATGLSWFSSFPPNSPDLNCIEHVWARIKRALESRRFKTLEALWTSVGDEWCAIPPQEIRNLTASMPERLAEVIRCRGGYTHY